MLGTFSEYHDPRVQIKWRGEGFTTYLVFISQEILNSLSLCLSTTYVLQRYEVSIGVAIFRLF